MAEVLDSENAIKNGDPLIWNSYNSLRNVLFGMAETRLLQKHGFDRTHNATVAARDGLAIATTYSNAVTTQPAPETLFAQLTPKQQALIDYVIATKGVAGLKLSEETLKHLQTSIKNPNGKTFKESELQSWSGAAINTVREYAAREKTAVFYDVVEASFYADVETLSKGGSIKKESVSPKQVTAKADSPKSKTHTPDATEQHHKPTQLLGKFGSAPTRQQ